MLSDAWEAVGGYGEECSTFIAKFPPTLDIAMSDQWGFLGRLERAIVSYTPFGSCHSLKVRGASG